MLETLRLEKSGFLLNANTANSSLADLDIAGNQSNMNNVIHSWDLIDLFSFDDLRTSKFLDAFHHSCLRFLHKQKQDESRSKHGGWQLRTFSNCRKDQSEGFLALRASRIAEQWCTLDKTSNMLVIMRDMIL